MTWLVDIDVMKPSTTEQVFSFKMKSLLLYSIYSLIAIDIL